MLKIAICDDTQSFLNQTLEVTQHWPNRPVQTAVTLFNDADALIEAHTADPFHIILLDVVMPLLNGIDAAAEIRKLDRSVKIVFLSVSPEFAVDSYTVKADNYLLKPIEPQKLYQCLDEMLAEMSEADKSITVKSSSAVYRVKVQDIEHLESQGKLVIFHLSNGQTLQSIEPLYAYENILVAEDGFFKCHRSYLVNLHKIRSYTHNEITMESDCRIPIARSYQKEFESVYFTTLFGKVGDI